MDNNLIRWFCCLPHVDLEQLQWRPEKYLERNLEKMLESEPGLSLEEASMIFIQQSRDGSDELAVKHLQGYLCRIAAEQSNKIHNKL